MTTEAKPVTVQILDKDYIVACRDEEREQLFSAVELLNRRMRELRESGKVIGAERIAVMAALNLAHELHALKRRNETVSGDMDATLRRIQDKLSGALSRRRPLVTSAS